MRNWIVILIVILALAVLNFNACEGQVEDNWHPKEPTQAQIVLLEKIYDEFEIFNYFSDTVRIEWGGLDKEKLNDLCDKDIHIDIDLISDYYQKPEETLTCQGGDCEDFAVLFVSAAKSIGVSARVVNGKMGTKGNIDEHCWAEIYYKRKWRIVDPWLPVVKRGVPFYHYLNYPEKYPQIAIDARFDDENMEGILPRAQLEQEKERMEVETLDFFSAVFLDEKKRAPGPEELEIIREIADSTFQKQWEIAWNQMPENPQLLIQPDNPALKAWIEEIKLRAENGKG